jgi:hypothetical protein
MLFWCWYRCPEIGTKSIDWAQLSSFYLKTETESSLRNVVFCNTNRTVFLDKDRTMDNFQKHNICTVSQLVHWCVLQVRFLATAIVYRVIT